MKHFWDIFLICGVLFCCSYFFCFGYILSEDNIFRDSPQSIVKDISNYNASRTEYVKNVYDCTEFSEDLVITLNSQGFNSYSVAGYILNGQYHIVDSNYINSNKINMYYLKNRDLNIKFWHQWVYVEDINQYVEATSGRFIPWDEIEYE